MYTAYLKELLYHKEMGGGSWVCREYFRLPDCMAVGYTGISLRSENRPVCHFLQKACISLSYFSFLGVTLHQTSS
ncbi:hypothetical protein BLA28_26675 [Eisenbergiella tayi]|nr:hypothetical protein BLA28_26675 [Eisenbergiella tayi]